MVVVQVVESLMHYILPLEMPLDSILMTFLSVLSTVGMFYEGLGPCNVVYVLALLPQ